MGNVELVAADVVLVDDVAVGVENLLDSVLRHLRAGADQLGAEAEMPGARVDDSV